MSRRASPTVVGGFMIGAVAIGIAGIVLFGSGRLFTHTAKYVLHFTGSLKGLSVGSPVTVQGIQIGSVVEINVLFDIERLEFRVPVIVEIDRSRFTRMRGSQVAEADPTMDEARTAQLLIDRGLRASLQVRSFVTGILEVALEFDPNSPVRLLGGDSPHPELPTVASSMEQLAQTLENVPLKELSDTLLRTVQGVERLLNSTDLEKTVAASHQTVEEVRELIRRASENMDRLSEKAAQGVDDTRALVKKLDSQVDPIASSLEGTLGDSRRLIGHLDEQMEPVLSRAPGVADAARSVLEQAEKSIQTLESMAGHDSDLRIELAAALKDLSAAARSIRNVTDYMERHPEALLRGKGGE